MSEFTLQDVLEDAIEVVYMGERYIVVDYDDAPSDEDVEPFISVLIPSSRCPNALEEWDIRLSELLNDPNLKVFHSTRVGFHRD